MNLLIAMPGPGLPEAAANTAALRAVMPALPVLSAMLARARCLPVATDWRAGVLRLLCGRAATAEIPAVAVAARALPMLPDAAALCFAEPLHVVAGISRVHLPPGGRLQLLPAEIRRWAEAFNHEIGGPELQLHAAGGGWLLAAPFADGACDADPETLLGQPLARSAARDESARALRRLGAEAEMWLAAQPLNREREARQLQPINSLWFWGGARVVELPPFARPLSRVCVAGQPDGWAAGLAVHGAATLQRVADWQGVAAAGALEDALLVLPTPAEGASAAFWQQLEAQWFAPAEAVLRAGGIELLQLQIGASAWQLPHRSPLRWLRRRRPWFELVQS